MKQPRFTWDPAKALVNEKKHGISFEEAHTIFYDDNARLEHDPDHSEDEERFLLLGLSERLRILLVCHCYRSDDDNEIRLISARKATKNERQQYEDSLP